MSSTGRRSSGRLKSPHASFLVSPIIVLFGDDGQLGPLKAERCLWIAGLENRTHRPPKCQASRAEPSVAVQNRCEHDIRCIPTVQRGLVAEMIEGDACAAVAFGRVDEQPPPFSSRWGAKPKQVSRTTPVIDETVREASIDGSSTCFTRWNPVS